MSVATLMQGQGFWRIIYVMINPINTFKIVMTIQDICHNMIRCNQDVKINIRGRELVELKVLI